MDFLAPYKQSIDSFLTVYLTSQAKNHTTFPWGEDILTKLLPFTISGKTIRGSLILLAAEGYNKAITRDLISITGAIELIHSGFLIHDDIIDNDRIRRKQDSIFVQYENISSLNNSSKKTDFGKNMATCIGDAAYFFGMQLLHQCSDFHYVKKLTATLMSEYSEVCLAQMQDIYMSMSPKFPTEKEILSMYMYKTARYTFSLPLYAGALYANVTDSELQNLITTGQNFGIVFQLTDDMLNVFGSPDQSGKSIFSDITAGKKTLLFTTLHTMVNKEEQKTMQSILQKATMTSEEQQFILRLIDTYDIRKLMQNKISDYSLKAKKGIEELTMLDVQKQQLLTLLTFLESRTY